MKRTKLLTRLLIPALIAWLTFSGFKFQELESADEIMAKVEQIHLVDSEIELFQVTTIHDDGSQTVRKILSIIRREPSGNYNYLIRFLEPEEVRGVTLLSIETGEGDSEQYLYLPALGQMKEIKASEQKGPFMGTDFTFDDLRKEKGPEYLYHRQLDEVIEGRECYTILSAPADDVKATSSGYSSRYIYVDKETYDILRIEFYDENEELTKTFEGQNYNSVDVDGPSKRPQKAIMKNHEKGSISIMHLLKSRLNYDIDPSLFTVETVEAWTPEYTQAYLAVFDTPQ